jgi:hypothetical protein
MAGLRSEAEILKAFEGLDRAPGSKQKRREPSEKAKKKRARILGESNGWDSEPIIKLVRGVETELFTISSLAQALEKQVVTVRYWEKKGFIPAAPYRLRSKNLNGKKVQGNRVYTKEMIEIAIEEFQKRGLLGSSRVEWNQHKHLIETLQQRWKKLVYNETES